MSGSKAQSAALKSKPPSPDKAEGENTPEESLSTLTAVVREAQRVSRQRGKNNAERAAFAEADALSKYDWVRRPVGKEMDNLLLVLHEKKKFIDPTSFDAVMAADGRRVKFSTAKEIREIFPQLIFIEIKSGVQERLTPDFSNFFFALTYKEMRASIALGKQHIVALLNSKKGEEDIRYTTVKELLQRSTSMNWQLSIQLGPAPGEAGEVAAKLKKKGRYLGEGEPEAVKPEQVFDMVSEVLARKREDEEARSSGAG